MSFGSELTSLRRRAKLSQLALSELSGVSQRHISFLESGRSKPGIKSVAKIAKALSLSYGTENGLYLKAGLAPPRPSFDILDEEFASARRVIERMLRRHNPYPAVATLRSGEIIQANEAFETAMSWAFGYLTPWRMVEKTSNNLFELTLHREGLRQYMVNPEQVIPHTVRRLKRAAGETPRAKDILNWVESDPVLRDFLHLSEPSSSAKSSVLIERYLIRERPLNLVSMVASFGSPEDVTSQAIQVEMFYPEDEESKKLLIDLNST